MCWNLGHILYCIYFLFFFLEISVNYELISFDLLIIYHVTLKVTKATHAKFIIVIRSVFGSVLLAGFRKPLSLVSTYFTWAHVVILTVAVL